MKKDFSEYLPFDVFQKAEKKSFKRDEKDWQTYQEIISNLIEPAFIKYIIDNKEELGLVAIHNSTGHNTNFSAAWNQFIGGEPMKKHDWRPITNNLANDYFFQATYFIKKEDRNDSSIKQRYEDLIEQVNKQDVSKCFNAQTHEASCFDCGQSMKIKMDGWQPTFTVYNPKATNMEERYIKPESCISNNIISLDVEFETGELLIADWIRIEEFTTASKAGKRFDINSSKGVIEQTTHYLKEHNFISVFVGNSSPTIYEHNNKLVFGREVWGTDEEEEDKEYTSLFKEKGTVCTDLWWVTIIDKSQLIKIVASSGIEQDAATKIVNEYLEKEGHNIERLNVEKGQYTLNFAADKYEFIEKNKDKEIKNEPITPYFTLEKSSPAPKKKKKIKP